MTQWLIGDLCLLFVLEEQFLARIFLSESGWLQLVKLMGGTVQSTPQGVRVTASFVGVALLSLLLLSIFNFLTACRRKSVRTEPFGVSAGETIRSNTFYFSPLILWTGSWVVGLLMNLQGLSTVLLLTLDICVSLSLAGWAWGIWCLTKEALPSGQSQLQLSDWNSASVWRVVGVAVVVYTLVFTAMNWGLWFSLRLPHGDSSMYEEHLWNLTHGKGFRSYLDQGLFLGEHIQVIHVLLTPLYLIWPSHLLLELCESLALASGAIPVYLIAKRHCQSNQASVLVALAYLLYFPMHYLDISIDLKTFRPIAFGVPLMLWVIDTLERRRWGWMAFLCLLTLSSKEDFAIVLAPLGLWLVVTTFISSRETQAVSTAVNENRVIQHRSSNIAGGILCVLSTAYLLFVVKLAIPWFRSGETVHYARYFSQFGDTPTEIVMNIFLQPGTLVSQFITVGSFVLLLQLVVPAGVPWRSWGRLLVGGPLFLLLCLNELAQQTPGPVHHFHAPLVPIVFWAVCSNLSRKPLPTARWTLCCALSTCLIFSYAPLSLRFWDSGRAAYWSERYMPDERAEQFAKVQPLIPMTARVASTDYVHPRFTHCERSYDYSNYLRKVADYLPKVPDDTEYIVIDTQHPYSEVRSPADVRELRDSPDEWEQLPDNTQGYFIVLRRKSIISDTPESPQLTRPE